MENDMQGPRPGPVALEIHPTGTVGAEISGVNLASLTDAEVAAIKTAWYSHDVLILRNQRLTGDDLLAFSRHLGAIDPPRVVANFKNNRTAPGYPDIFVVSNRLNDAGEALGDLGNGEVIWHSDLSYQPDPPDASMLFALEIPPEGGNTWFASMRAALAKLPPQLVERIGGLQIKHDASLDACGNLRQGMTLQDPRISPGATHPIIVEHPVTKAHALYLGRRRNAYVVGLELAESEALLDELWSFVTTAVHCHRWAVGDIVLWDNRSVMHRRDPFDPQAHRTMHRTQIKGTAAPRSPAQSAPRPTPVSFSLNRLGGEPTRPLQLLTQQQSARISRFFETKESNYKTYEGAYQKVVYGSMLWESEEFRFIAQALRDLLGNGYELFGDLYLELAKNDSGFQSWHTDHNSLAPLENPFDMFSAWISLGFQSRETGGGLYVSAPDSVSVQLARMSHIQVACPAVGALYECAVPKVEEYLQQTAAVHHLSDGQCLLFSNALYHRTEPVKLAGYVRKCLILRIVKTPLQVNEERLVALERKGTASAWVRRWRELLRRQG
jgi:taurine dioxygenase